jgi:hypothetical protein
MRIREISVITRMVHIYERSTGAFMRRRVHAMSALRGELRSQPQRMGGRL